MKKLVELSLYRRLRAKGVFMTPTVAKPRLAIDTETVSPCEAAAMIAAAN